jgi:gliding motility-associated-like protein
VGPGPYSITWNTSPVQTGSIATNLGAGTYTVNITGGGACPATGIGKVETDLSCIGVYFPTAFTPNGDTRNDAFGPLGSLSALSNYHLSIYNRWGERIFSSTNPFEKWDGAVKGYKTDSNTFIWYTEFTLPGQPKQLRKGFITLIR